MRPRETIQAFDLFLAGQEIKLEAVVVGGTALALLGINVARILPDAWELRLQDVFLGQALTLRSLGRADLLLTKLFALCDRGQDIADCIALAPTPEELERALPWVARQDANALWPSHVAATLADLARRLGHGV